MPKMLIFKYKIIQKGVKNQIKGLKKHGEIENYEIERLRVIFIYFIHCR